MTFDFLAKHTIIIGVVTILASFLVAISMLGRLVNFLALRDEFGETNEDFSKMITLLGFSLSVCLLVIILSSLKIYGVVKKRPMLMAPWLAGALLFSVFFSGVTLYQSFIFSFSLDFLLHAVVLIGCEIIVIYPIWKLFIEMRRANTGKTAQIGSNYAQNIQGSHFEKVHQKPTV